MDTGEKAVTMLLAWEGNRRSGVPCVTDPVVYSPKAQYPLTGK